MGFQQQQQQKQNRFDHHHWIEKDQFQWRAEQQQQQELLRYQHLQQKEQQQQQQQQQLSRMNFHITPGNDGIGSSQPQFHPSPNISHRRHYQDQQQSQAKRHQYQEEQMPKHQAQFHTFSISKFAPASSTTSRVPWGVSGVDCYGWWRCKCSILYMVGHTTGDFFSKLSAFRARVDTIQRW